LKCKNKRFLSVARLPAALPCFRKDKWRFWAIWEWVPVGVKNVECYWTSSGCSLRMEAL